MSEARRLQVADDAAKAEGALATLLARDCGEYLTPGERGRYQSIMSSLRNTYLSLTEPRS